MPIPRNSTVYGLRITASTDAYAIPRFCLHNRCLIHGSNYGSCAYSTACRIHELVYRNLATITSRPSPVELTCMTKASSLYYEKCLYMCVCVIILIALIVLNFGCGYFHCTVKITKKKLFSLYSENNQKSYFHCTVKIINADECSYSHCTVKIMNAVILTVQ